MNLEETLAKANLFWFYREDDFDYKSDEYQCKGDINLAKTILDYEKAHKATSVCVDIDLDEIEG